MQLNGFLLHMHLVFADTLSMVYISADMHAMKFIQLAAIYLMHLQIVNARVYSSSLQLCSGVVCLGE